MFSRENALYHVSHNLFRKTIILCLNGQSHVEELEFNTFLLGTKWAHDISIYEDSKLMRITKLILPPQLALHPGLSFLALSFSPRNSMTVF